MDTTKFYAASIDEVKALKAEEFECIEPTFLVYRDGKRIKTIIGESLSENG